MSAANCKYVYAIKKQATSMICFTPETVYFEELTNTRRQISLKECKLPYVVPWFRGSVVLWLCVNEQSVSSCTRKISVIVGV